MQQQLQEDQQRQNNKLAESGTVAGGYKATAESENAPLLVCFFCHDAM